jgi:hypothetical protein
MHSKRLVLEFHSEGQKRGLGSRRDSVGPRVPVCNTFYVRQFSRRFMRMRMYGQAGGSVEFRWFQCNFRKSPPVFFLSRLHVSHAVAAQCIQETVVGFWGSFEQQ